MAVNTMDLTRNIRDSIYEKIKNLSKDEQIKFYRMQALKLNRKLQRKRKSKV